MLNGHDIVKYARPAVIKGTITEPNTPSSPGHPDKLNCKHFLRTEFHIHQGRIQEFPLGGAPTLVGGGANLRHRHFLVKTSVKTKEFGPVGGGHTPETFVCRSATVHEIQIYFHLQHDIKGA